MSAQTPSAPRCAFCNDGGLLSSRDVARVDPAPGGGFLTTYRGWLRLCSCVQADDVSTEPVAETYRSAINIKNPLRP